MWQDYFLKLGTDKIKDMVTSEEELGDKMKNPITGEKHC